MIDRIFCCFVVRDLSLSPLACAFAPAPSMSHLMHICTHYAVRCSCMGIHPPPPPPVVSPSRGGEGAPSARMAAEISHVNFCFCCCTFAFFAFRPCNFKVVHPPQIQPPPTPSPWGRRPGARPRASPGHQRRPAAATVLRWSPTSFGCSFSSSSWFHS